MTTTTIKQIDPTGGGDYTTLAAWVAARKADLVATDRIEIAEIHGGGSVGALLLTATDWVTDATHYIIVRAAAGHAHLGKFNSTTKAFITTTGTEPVHIHSLGYVTLGPGISIQQDTADNGIVVRVHSNSHHILLDSLIIHTNGNNIGVDFNSITNATPNEIKNCVVRAFSGGVGGNACIQTTIGTDNNLNIYNCTIINDGTSAGSNCIVSAGGGTRNSQNNYLAQTGGQPVYEVITTLNKGANDATNTTEAVTPALRSIAFSSANFVDTVFATEDLHLTTTSALRTKGADLSAASPFPVTNDFEGDNRVGLFYDVGADQASDVPVCWNYTAKYRNSNKLFKASGCGSFPTSLRVPGNVDPSTGRMIDDGQLINPDEYDVV